MALKNIQFKCLPKKRVPSEVNSLVSLGMVPVRALIASVFGDEKQKVIKWHDKKTREKQ